MPPQILSNVTEWDALCVWASEMSRPAYGGADSGRHAGRGRGRPAGEIGMFLVAVGSWPMRPVGGMDEGIAFSDEASGARPSADEIAMSDEVEEM